MVDSPYMINAEKLVKRFGTKLAVDELSFTVNKGEILGFLGPNAAGKTTTMKMLTCFFPPSGGTATVNGFDIYGDSMQVRRSIGFMPENIPLYTDMTVREYLEFVARAKGVAALEREKAVKDTLGLCNLESVQNQLIGTISRGYKQRTGLAQAIVNTPPVLILDEPTVGLDPAQIRDIRELIRSFAGKSTVILSTHILPEVSLTCDRVIIMNRGKALAVDTPDNLRAKTQKKKIVTVELVAPVEEAQRVFAAIEGVTAVSQKPVENAEEGQVVFTVEAPREHADVRSQVAAAVSSHGWNLFELREEKLSLEDVFLSILGENALNGAHGIQTADEHEATEAANVEPTPETKPEANTSETSHPVLEKDNTQAQAEAAAEVQPGGDK